MRLSTAGKTALLAVGIGWVVFGAAPARKAAEKTAPRQPAMTDAALEQAIRAKFAKSKISSNQFQVKVQGGIATIDGTTGVIQHKGTATRLAKTAGARQVVNRVKISEDARKKAAANLEKGRRRAQVKRTEARRAAGGP